VHHVKLTCFERELQLYWRFTNSMTKIIGTRTDCEWPAVAPRVMIKDTVVLKHHSHHRHITRSCLAKDALSHPSALSSTVLDLCASSKAGPKPSFLFLTFKVRTDDCRHQKHD
jgi:hypothetical protein